MTDVLSPVPSPVQLRTMLEEMVVGDLLGPAGGPDEELTERNVRDRYLVGVLAPRSQPRPTPAKVDEEDDEETPLLPDELSEGGADTVDDGTTDKDVPIVQAHLPSSFGLTFCVDKSAKALKVEVRWGQYKRETKPDQIDERTGRPKRVWKRYQRSGVVTLKLDRATVKPTSVHDDFPNVYVRGQVRKRDHGIVVTLFLVNGQEEGRPKDESHLFQPELIVTDPDGGAIFCQRLTRKTSARTDPGTKLEDDTMAMLYRRHAEFAVGHEISVHAESSPDAPDRTVAAAYGWTGLDLGHGFHRTKQGLRYTLSEPARREILARLLTLNHERYAEEVKQGLHEKKKPRNTRKTRKKPEESGGMFG
jgi:hypothetical protein